MTSKATSLKAGSDILLAMQKNERKPVGLTRPLITGDLLVISAVRAV